MHSRSRKRAPEDMGLGPSAKTKRTAAEEYPQDGQE